MSISSSRLGLVHLVSRTVSLSRGGVLNIVVSSVDVSVVVPVVADVVVGNSGVGVVDNVDVDVDVDGDVVAVDGGSDGGVVVSA